MSPFLALLAQVNLLPRREPCVLVSSFLNHSSSEMYLVENVGAFGMLETMAEIPSQSQHAL